MPVEDTTAPDTSTIDSAAVEGAGTTPVVLDLEALRRRLTVLVAALVVMHMAIIPVLTSDPGRALRRVASMISLDEERGVGTLVAACLLMACAGLCWYAARQGPAWSRRRWGVLAVALGFVALDEVVAIHEGLDQALFDVTSGEAFLTFLWVIPYGLAALALGIAYVPFLRRLRRDVAGRLLLGGALFVGGALGLEVLGSQALDTYGFGSAPFLVLTGLEEGLELTGVSVALLGMLRHLQTLPTWVRVGVSSATAPPGGSTPEG